MAAQTVLLSNQRWKEVNPIQFGWERCAPGHSFGPASRSHLLLHYVVSGRGTFTARGNRYSLVPGQIFIIHPYEMTYYEADRESPWHYIWVGFELSLPLPEALEGDVLVLPQAEQLFSSMRQAASLPAGREAFLCGKIWELLSLLQAAPCREPGRQGRAADYVNAAKTYLETEYMRGVSVSGLARRLNLDRSYFSGLFRRETGKSPQQYLTCYRLEKGAELLREHGQTPSEAALSTGYSDVFSFSRMFKRHFGVSPTEYLESVRAAGADGKKSD